MSKQMKMCKCKCNIVKNWTKKHCHIIICILICIIILGALHHTFSFAWSTGISSDRVTMLGSWISGLATAILGGIALWQNKLYRKESQKSIVLTSLQNRLTDYEKIFDKYAYSLNLNDYIEDILNRNSNRQVMQKKIDARIVDERYQLLILKRKLEHEECFENRQAVYTAIEEFEDDIIEYLFECDFEKVWYGIHRYEDRKAVLLSELEQFIELADVMIKFYSLHSFDEIAKDQERIKFKNKEIESDVDEE